MCTALMDAADGLSTKSVTKQILIAIADFVHSSA